ncbi:iron ABC transporter permease [Shewanella sp. 202IG2-18]|uniref:FecCD family ABC transporter permease n=1 Tax=Parashewanella hymeniacidonis TaxID=2807618 RepID=UPI0019616B3B|nr:iron ABC transporter permease [Parashewanella hymeniacidonis]MBM7071789.1 iron ABC transporter permease [Parashewanella hymeniacidonis]
MTSTTSSVAKASTVRIPLFISLFLLLVSIVFSLGFGAADVSFSQAFNALLHALNSSHQVNIIDRIIIELRLPRVLLAALAGSGLAIAGHALQTVLRNPLADPFLFGISSGASLGAITYLTLFSSQVAVLSSFGHIGLSMAAFIGASLSVVIVIALSGRGLAQLAERMLLAGVAVSFMFGALSSLMLYFADPRAAAAVLFWSLGSFTKASWDNLTMPFVIVALCFICLWLFRRLTAALQLGDETAHTLGINVAKVRLGILLVCSLLTATLVAACGGIGFVGLMIPHAVRMLFPNQSPFFLTAFLGASFMVWVDVLARTLLANQELPVGIITAAIGSVFFIFLLSRQKRS